MALDPYDDFRNVLYVIWMQIIGKPPTPAQYDLAHWMQHGPKRQIDLAFRGIGKSYIASAYSVDELRKDPTLACLAVSASKKRADDFAKFARQIIREVPLFQHLAPREGQRDAVDGFDVAGAPPAHAPSFKSAGITGQLAGYRADSLIADDVEIPNNSQTSMMREKLGESVKEFDAILKPDSKERKSRIIYLGTPQTEQTLYLELEKRGYTTRVWPARFPAPDQVAMYGEKLAPFIREKIDLDRTLVGKPTDPDRFNEIDLMEREASYGRSGFALQFMLDTRLSDAHRYPLKVSDLVVMDLDTEVAPERVVWARSPELEIKGLPCVGFNGDRFYRPLSIDKQLSKYTGSVMAIDPSGRGRDETAYAIVKILCGQLFLTECKGLTGGYGPEVLRTLALRAKAHKVNRIITEANFGDGMFSQLLKPVIGAIHPCTIEEVKHHSMQKEKRIIDTLEPVLNSHKLIVATKVIEQDGDRDIDSGEEEVLSYQLIHQLSHITRDRGALRHDDRLDALAIAVAYWVEHMSADTELQAQAAQEDRVEAELRRFMGSSIVLGAPEEETLNWLPKRL